MDRQKEDFLDIQKKLDKRARILRHAHQALDIGCAVFAVSISWLTTGYLIGNFPLHVVVFLASSILILGLTTEVFFFIIAGLMILPDITTNVLSIFLSGISIPIFTWFAGHALLSMAEGRLGDKLRDLKIQMARKTKEQS
jgi:hypothetical protein